MTDVGILAYGGYVPAARVRRADIAEANRWVNPSPAALGTSERSVCGWDEDAVTLAVEAGRDCLRSGDAAQLGALLLGSSTLPHRSRLNAAIVAGALGLSPSTPTADVAGGLRAGTAAMRIAFDAAAARGRSALCIASGTARAAAATTEELTFGHGAAALLIGPGDGIAARLKATATATADLVDHEPATFGNFDRPTEARWVRDEGYLTIVAGVISDLLSTSNVEPARIDHVCVPEHGLRVAGALARAAGLRTAAIADALWEGCGDCGAAHALMMLVRTLEIAEPGEHILVAGFGQGADAFLFEVTEAIRKQRQVRTGLSQSLQRSLMHSYPRYLALQGLVEIDAGPRAEAVQPSSKTASYRHRDLLLSMNGGVCESCATAQIPSERICVNPECGLWDSQRPHSFRDSSATVASWTADTLTYTPDPPARYGMVDFDEGGRLMIDFTDIPPEGIDVGAKVRFVFRAKSVDQNAIARSYFWKAAPCAARETQARA